VPDGALVRELAGPGQAPAGSVAYAADGQTVAAGQGTHLVLWRAGEWTPHDLGDQQSNVTSVAFSPDGQLLAVGTEDGIVRLWQVKAETLLRPLTQHNFAVRSLAFSSDQQTVASASDDETIHLSSATLATAGRTLNVAAGSVAFTPDGMLLAAGCPDGAVRFWNVQDGTLHQTWQGPDAIITSIAFTPDGQLLAVGSADSTIALWRVSDGTSLWTLHGQGALKTVLLGRDSRLLVTAGAENVIQLWATVDLATPSP
jgi:WD40 repeat protein